MNKNTKVILITVLLASFLAIAIAITSFYILKSTSKEEEQKTGRTKETVKKEQIITNKRDKSMIAGGMKNFFIPQKSILPYTYKTQKLMMPMFSIPYPEKWKMDRKNDLFIRFFAPSDDPAFPSTELLLIGHQGSTSSYDPLTSMLMTRKMLDAENITSEGKQIPKIFTPTTLEQINGVYSNMSSITDETDTVRQHFIQSTGYKVVDNPRGMDGYVQVTHAFNWYYQDYSLTMIVPKAKTEKAVSLLEYMVSNVKIEREKALPAKRTKAVKEDPLGISLLLPKGFKDGQLLTSKRSKSPKDKDITTVGYVMPLNTKNNPCAGSVVAISILPDKGDGYIHNNDGDLSVITNLMAQKGLLISGEINSVTKEATEFFDPSLKIKGMKSKIYYVNANLMGGKQIAGKLDFSSDIHSIHYVLDAGEYDVIISMVTPRQSISAREFLHTTIEENTRFTKWNKLKKTLKSQ